MKILTAKQIQELDKFTIQHEPIASIDLMERACRAFVDWFTQHISTTKKTGVVCGSGNNGGDGLGIARMLHDWGYPVKVWIVRGLVPESPDFKINLERLPPKIAVSEIVTEADRNLFHDQDVLIDAIFGTGLSRPPEGIYAQAIQCMNASPALKIAVDIPSGLMTSLPSTGAVVQAGYTITFQMPKLSFLFPQSYSFTGEWVVADIGLNKKFITEAESPYYFLQKKDIARMIKPRRRHDHKGTFGHALLISGSMGKMGAAVLASRAALRAGAGLVTAYSPSCGYSILQTAVPEAMVITDPHDHFMTVTPEVDRFTTVGIGPGLGQEAATLAAFSGLLEKCKVPMVVDADALNLLSARRELWQLLPENSILTPHPGEFERLVGSWNDDFERLEKLKELAYETRSVIVLKGAFTSVATSDGRVFFNSTGNPGMATGGTGDVLTGIVTGLLAQGYSSLDAAVVGVFLHGLAADLAVPEKGYSGLIASDLIDFLPQAFLKVSRK